MARSDGIHTQSIFTRTQPKAIVSHLVVHTNESHVDQHKIATNTGSRHTYYLLDLESNENFATLGFYGSFPNKSTS